ncbi:ACT domain-containing protein [Luteibacter jiangsuensis]|uniref:ACT domain-containing protein n=1 Tax=Luteibacter jiangsuensis TaxID=637577 RepID=A0ABX0Q1A3_9GAMM|nr:ACT domain-containing protein [Luteibacter jiangsuensis]NID04083.1 ACT domain-containing protein [Luteibacter jiangsuensis]
MGIAGSAPGLTDLRALLAALDPEIDPVPKRFLHVSHEKARERMADALMMFREAEGTTLIVDVDHDDIAGSERLLWARITLRVQSSLTAVGMMAAVSAALARRGIPCNPVSAFLHDHIFVPWERRDDALDALSHLTP